LLENKQITVLPLSFHFSILHHCDKISADFTCLLIANADASYKIIGKGFFVVSCTGSGYHKE